MAPEIIFRRIFPLFLDLTLKFYASAWKPFKLSFSFWVHREAALCTFKIFWKQQPLQFFVPIGESTGQVNSYLMILSLVDLLVPRRSVHRQANHTTIRPTLSVHPTIRRLWQFASVTFWLKVDGLFVHPKIKHFVLKTWMCCHVETLRPTVIFYPKVDVILSMYFCPTLLWHFVPTWYKLHFSEKFSHFHSLSHVITDPQRAVYEVNARPQLHQDIA